MIILYVDNILITLTAKKDGIKKDSLGNQGAAETENKGNAFTNNSLLGYPKSISGISAGYKIREEGLI